MTATFTGIPIRLLLLCHDAAYCFHGFVTVAIDAVVFNNTASRLLCST